MNINVIVFMFLTTKVKTNALIEIKSTRKKLATTKQQYDYQIRRYRAKLHGANNRG
jgi:hypothetical protein